MGWIDDPITELAHFTNRRLLEVGRVVGDGIGGLIYSIKVLVLTPKESRKAYRRRLTESEENARIAGCKKVTLDFATMLGYISREVMSKEELESLIFESG